MTTKQYYVYIITNKFNSTLYTGITSDLVKRIYEHKYGVIDSFASKYKLAKLVYYETHEEINEAIKKEKQLKRWHKEWKVELIEKANSHWDDLYYEIVLK